MVPWLRYLVVRGAMLPSAFSREGIAAPLDSSSASEGPIVPRFPSGSAQRESHVSDLERDVERFLKPMRDKEKGLVTLEEIANDKSYQEAVTGDRTVEKATQIARLSAGIVGAFYRELIESGMPHDYAQKITDDFWPLMHEKLRQGFEMS